MRADDVISAFLARPVDETVDEQMDWWALWWGREVTLATEGPVGAANFLLRNTAYVLDTEYGMS